MASEEFVDTTMFRSMPKQACRGMIGSEVNGRVGLMIAPFKRMLVFK
jgi:hypothetical protein